MLQMKNYQAALKKKIVICDDCMEDLALIKELLLKYKETSPCHKFKLETYTNSSLLYDRIQQKELADIYILDMIMSEKTGIDLGQQIRKIGDENVIIYITSSDDFALDAYNVHAVRYLLKPVSEAKMFEALTYALSYTEVKKETVFLVKTKDGLICVPYSKIEYIENCSRTLEVHLTDGELVKSIFIRTSFDEEIREILTDKNFIQVHKSFLVNLKNIKKLTRNSVIMDSGKNIPISQKRAAAVKKEYLLFVSTYYN